eukprot:scaffold18595_cov65-Phaeocystis_antarctica.AAC.1
MAGWRRHGVLCGLCVLWPVHAAWGGVRAPCTVRAVCTPPCTHHAHTMHTPPCTPHRARPRRFFVLWRAADGGDAHLAYFLDLAATSPRGVTRLQ